MIRTSLQTLWSRHTLTPWGLERIALKEVIVQVWTRRRAKDGVSVISTPTLYLPTSYMVHTILTCHYSSMTLEAFIGRWLAFLCHSNNTNISWRPKTQNHGFSATQWRGHFHRPNCGSNCELQHKWWSMTEGISWCNKMGHQQWERDNKTNVLQAIDMANLQLATTR